MGKVYLIGAGPGNEELLTLKAVRVLKKCTAVMYDRLAGEHVLNYLNNDCQIYFCGKEPGCHYKSQDEINEMLVKLAKEGHVVGRIKGGDPYVFGRGGEEGEALFNEDIEFEVIPGVTSAISVLSYAGIPITSRGYSQGFHVFTGMSAEKLNIDWEAAAKMPGTLVFLMGLENMETIMERLTAAGKDIDTPSAVIMRGTTSKQKTVTGTMKDICEKVRAAGLKSPCIIVIGKVVELSDILNWYEKKPLFGMNVCVTRSKEQAAVVKEQLMDLGAEVTEINAIVVKPTTEGLSEYTDSFSKYDYIVLTSVNAVNVLFDYMVDNNIDVRNLKGKFAVIGNATEKALMQRGIKAHIKAEEFVGESLAGKLEAVINLGESVFIPASKEAREHIKNTLIEAGAEVDQVPIYELIPGDLKGRTGFQQVDVVLYTSPSTVKNMIKMFGVESLQKKKAVAIGPITRAELVKNNIRCYESSRQSMEAVIMKLLEIAEEER